MKRKQAIGWLLTLCLACFPSTAAAQPRDAAAWTAHVGSAYDLTPGLTYHVASGAPLKLDVYSPRGRTTPNPVAIYFHGGGWAGGTRDRAVLRFMPYLELGFTVVNATYRGAAVALAPAAVEDARCVVRWVVANAPKHHFDVDRIVLTGDSAGSHLALTAGMATADAGLDGACPGATPKVAAVVSWFGATDVADLLEGPNAQPFAIAWLGNQPDRVALARRVSPLSYARPGAPPVVTVHGDADPVVPYDHARRLHAALTKHGVKNQLITVPKGGHGGFVREQNESSFEAIRVFLRQLDLLPRR